MAGEKNREQDRDLAAERYRQAAVHALDQLQWCINYLYSIRKASIAGTLESNRSQILKRARLRR
jgi:hypothetical protein